VSNDKIHQLTEDSLGGDCFRHAVADKSHHHIEGVLVLNLHLEALILDLLNNYLDAVLLELDPSSSNDRNEQDEVDNVIVGPVVKRFAYNAYEEDQAYSEVLRFDEEVYLLHIVGGKEDAVPRLEALKKEENYHFNKSILSV